MSRPVAVMENRLAFVARTRKARSSASAAASNAGPRFADVAGRLMLNSVIDKQSRPVQRLILPGVQQFDYGIDTRFQNQWRALVGFQTCALSFLRHSCEQIA